MHLMHSLGIVHRDGSVVLVKQAFGGHYWMLPGCPVESGESLTSAAKRGVRSQTGLETQVQGLIAVRDCSDSTCCVFALEILGGDLIDEVPREIEAVRWFTSADLKSQSAEIDQFTHYILERAFKSGMSILKMESWDGYAAREDLLI